MKLENECGLLNTIRSAFLSPLEFKKIFGYEISEERRAGLKDRGNKLGGLDEVTKKSKQLEKEYDKNLSEIAELLEEEEGFEIKEFEDQLGEEQFLWLKTHIGEIKRHLKGIEI